MAPIVARAGVVGEFGAEEGREGVVLVESKGVWGSPDQGRERWARLGYRLHVRPKRTGKLFSGKIVCFTYANGTKTVTYRIGTSG